MSLPQKPLHAFSSNEPTKQRRDRPVSASSRGGTSRASSADGGKSRPISAGSSRGGHSDSRSSSKARKGYSDLAVQASVDRRPGSASRDRSNRDRSGNRDHSDRDRSRDGGRSASRDPSRQKERGRSRSREPGDGDLSRAASAASHRSASSTRSARSLKASESAGGLREGRSRGGSAVERTRSSGSEPGAFFRALRSGENGDGSVTPRKKSKGMFGGDRRGGPGEEDPLSSQAGGRGLTALEKRQLKQASLNNGA